MKNPFSFAFVWMYLILLVSPAWSQKKEDVIYLSGGTIIRGILLPDSGSATVRIVNHAGDTWVFDRGEVDSVKRERSFEYKAFRFNQPGFEFNLNAEFLGRSGSSAIGKAVIPGINMGSGYRINPYISVGTELGMEFFELMEAPLSVYVRVRSSNRALAPLAFLRAGYTLPAEKRKSDWDYQYTGKGGAHASAGIGIERILNENASFLFSFSYHYQELHYHLTPLQPWVQERDRSEYYSRFRFALGYVFK